MQEATILLSRSMNKITDKKLLKLITYAPASIVAIFMLLWVILITRSVILSSEQKLKSQLEEYQQHERETLVSRVEYVTQQITYARSQTVNQLESTAKDRVYEAYNIASHLYESNKQLPKAQVTKLITDALRDIRFNDGRGYFVIYETNGLNIMHPLQPQVEGTSLWNFKDIRGNYSVRESIEQVKEKDESFYRWWSVKPDIENEELEKIGFGKYFEPYGWVIETSDYVIDVENDIKKTLLNWLINVRFSDFGYVFVLKEDGTILAHIDKNLIGKNTFEMEDQASYKLGQKIIVADKEFITYTAPLGPDGLSDFTKTSYVVKNSSWGWVIGAGVYNEITNHYLSEKIQQAHIEQRNTLKQMSVMGFITTVIVALASIILSRLIAKRFIRFEERINHDFDNLQSTKDELEYLASHDVLTGLPNRSHLHEHIAERIEISEKNGRQLAVIFADLDDFKKVNDLYGHSVGDKLLNEISNEFEAFLGVHDFVARFGGDEFLFCFPNLTNQAEAQLKIEQIKNLLKPQFTIDGKALFIGCSIGVSMYPTDGNEPEVLISKADIVLYRSKARQKGDVLFFDVSIDKQAQYEFLLERELRGAIERHELSIVYQPQVDARTGELYGVESLLRWYNHQLGHVSPLEFISLAEKIGLIGQLGEFVLNKACEEFSHLFPSPESNLILAINISPMQLIGEQFINQLQTTLTKHQLPSYRINLEITENVFINDLPKVAPIIAQLKELGFTISLDDFGTGYSSLSYLSNLSLDELKIDRTFVDKMFSSKQSDSLIKAILAIAKSVDMRVIAEGVETKEQKEILTQYGCDILQGYWIDRPITIEQLAEKYSHINK